MKADKKKIIGWSVYGVVVVAVLIFVFTVILPDSGDGFHNSSWSGYSATGYRYYYSTERERAWEEDVVYLADTYLQNHPALTQKDCYIYTDASDFSYDTAYSGEMYDAQLQMEFVEGINELIPRLWELSDQQITLELQGILSGVDGVFNLAYSGQTEVFLPFTLETIYENGSVSFYAVDVPKEHEAALFGKLTAINGVSIYNIAQKFTNGIYRNNPYWACSVMTDRVLGYQLLTDWYILVSLGVVDSADTAAELTFEAESGSYTCNVDFVTPEEYEAVEMIKRNILTQDLLSYRGWVENNAPNWWEYMKEENAVYWRILSTYDTDDQRFDKIPSIVLKQLRETEKPAKLIIDLRCMYNGYPFETVFRNFTAAVNNLETDGIYILIDDATRGQGVTTAYQLARELDGAVLVGSPAGSSVNSYSYLTVHTLPNSGCRFWCATATVILDSEDRDCALRPDIEVYQTIEDCKKGVDTVLEHVLSLE